MHKLFRNGFEGLNTSIDPHTFMYFKAPVHGSSIPGYISREGYIARLTYPQRLCSLYGGLWASRVTLRSLLVCIPSEEGWFPLLSLLKTDNLWVDAFLFWNLPEWFWLHLLAYTHHHAVFYCGIGVAVKWIVFENFTGADDCMVLILANIVLGPRWTTDGVIHCTVCFHFQQIMNQLVPKLIHLCQENRNSF